jgi:hypothetical protein
MAGFFQGFNGTVLHQHGEHATGLAFFGAATLQWDRASSARRARERESLRRITTRLQWEPTLPDAPPLAPSASMGPCFISTESKSKGGTDDVSSFNGTVLHQHVELARAGMMASSTGLQWDRASSARRAHPRADEQAHHLASMGPCFISTESSQPTSSPGASSGFNGTVLHQHGEHGFGVPVEGGNVLQWDRASSARRAS